ncbi:unnamed protein product [Knipowitschia caucasica]
MSKAHTLRALMTARLAAATEEVLVLFERTIQEYEEELRLSKEETHRTRAVLNSLLYPRVRLHQAAAEESPEPALNHGPNHGPDNEIPEPSLIKEEPEEQAVKQQQDQLPEQFPECSAVCVKNLESSQQPELKEETLELHLLPETEPDPAHSYDDWGGPFSCSNLQDHNNQVQTAVQNSHLSFDCDKSAPETRVHDAGTAEGSKRAKETQQCSVCQKMMGGKTRKRLRFQTGERPYSCSVCVKTFTSMAAGNQGDELGAAERAKVKVHQCPVCKKILKGSRTKLHKHMRIHTGERPYSCSVCEKTFRTIDHLRTHNTVHTGDKPFSCSFCQKEYSYPSGLKNHIQRKHLN